MEIHQTAAGDRNSVAEWCTGRAGEPGIAEVETVSAKLGAIADAVVHDFPTCDIEEMLDEIDAGSN